MPIFWRLRFFIQELNFLSSRISEQSLFCDMIFEILFIFKFFVERIMNSGKFHCVFLRSIFFISQTATFTPFFTQIPDTSNFSLFSFSPERNENSSRNLKASKANFLFLKKKLVASAYAVYQNYGHKYPNLSHWCLIWLIGRKLLKYQWRRMQRLKTLMRPSTKSKHFFSYLQRKVLDF